MVQFDPYCNWLGIPPHEQPPTHYRLLGIPLFESNPNVIVQAAQRQMYQVQSFQAGPYGQACQQILDHLVFAQACLLDPQQKAYYDRQLAEALGPRTERIVASPPLPSGTPPFYGTFPGAMPSAPPAGPPSTPQSMPGPAPAPMPVPMSAPMPGPVPPAAQPLAAAAVAVARPIPVASPRVAPQPVGPPVQAPAEQSPFEAAIGEDRPAASRSHRKLHRKSNGVPKEMIILGIVAGVGGLLLLAFLVASSVDNGNHGWGTFSEGPPAPPHRKTSVVEKAAKDAAKKREDDRFGIKRGPMAVKPARVAAPARVRPNSPPAAVPDEGASIDRPVTQSFPPANHVPFVNEGGAARPAPANQVPDLAPLPEEAEDAPPDNAIGIKRH
ncbi:MAG: hypothetical protein ABR915_13025 [Thermoguttaceae bacterium]|jgi:hypothetical protein